MITDNQSHLVEELTEHNEVCQVLKCWRQEQLVAWFAIPWIPGA